MKNITKYTKINIIIPKIKTIVYIQLEEKVLNIIILICHILMKLNLFIIY